MRKSRLGIYAITCVISLSLCGCSQLDSIKNTVQKNVEWREKLESDNQFRVSKDIIGSIPTATGKKIYESKNIILDYSNSNKGYIMLQYIGKKKQKIKIRITCPNEVVYTYDCVKGQDFNTFPLAQGDGAYTVNVFEQVNNNEYLTIDSTTLQVEIKDKRSPFLYSNQYVNFTADTHVIQDAKKLYCETETDLEFIEMVYDYTQAALKYDNEKANEALEGKLAGYIPNIDEVYKVKKGICFDYAVIMVAMLRSQGVPSKLNIGYAGDVYHAWVSVFTEEKGWIDDIIEFNGEEWSYIDPTYADTVSDQKLKRYVGEGVNYVEEYVY